MFAQVLLLGAIAALAAAQSNVLTFTRVPNPVTDGQPQAILYSTNDTTTPVTIILRKGPSSDLQTVEVLTTTATEGQFIWTPKSSLPDDTDYALEIKQGNQINYFGPFTVQGAVPASISASASAASANATMTHNATMTGTGASMGTGTTMHRNTTMPHHTTNHTTTTTGKHLHTTKHTPATTKAKTTHHKVTGASFQGSSATGGAKATQTGAAVSDYSTSSSLALVFGAVAALMYLH